MNSITHLLISCVVANAGELSTNPACLSGSFGFFDSPARFSGQANKTDSRDRTNETDQFRFSVLVGLDQQSLRRRESLQPQQFHESLWPRPAN